MNSAELLALLTAVGHPQRLRIIAELDNGRVHVSALARRLGLSRPLLYLHIDRLKQAGLVSTDTELSEDGKARNYIQLAPFELTVTPGVVRAALDADPLPDVTARTNDKEEET